MNTLVVGTGSVGRVFAHHLHRAGCAGWSIRAFCGAAEFGIPAPGLWELKNGLGPG